MRLHDLYGHLAVHSHWLTNCLPADKGELGSRAPCVNHSCGTLQAQQYKKTLACWEIRCIKDVLKHFQSNVKKWHIFSHTLWFYHYCGKAVIPLCCCEHFENQGIKKHQLKLECTVVRWLPSILIDKWSHFRF